MERKKLANNKYAVVTPTYVGHFHFIKKYIESFSKYSRGEKIPLYLTVEENDIYELQKICSVYPDVDVRIISFEAILSRFGIKKNTSELLSSMGRFSYQTIKKLYTLLYIKEEKTLVIDSESMMVADCDLSLLFDHYFASPFVSYSELGDKEFNSTFTKSVVDNSSYLLCDNNDKYFLENFVWFYDKSILQDLCREVGSPYDMVMRLETEKRTNLFEIQIYHHFIYKNRVKYKYDAINVINSLKNRLETAEFSSYMNKYYELYKGNCGVLERAASCVDKHNWYKVATLLKDIRFNIIRSEYSSRMKYHSLFIHEVNPFLLCASQDHSFGINSNWFNKLIDMSDTRWEIEMIKNNIGKYINSIRKSVLYRVPRVIIKFIVNPIRYILN